MRYVNHSNVGFCPLKRPFSCENCLTMFCFLRVRACACSRYQALFSPPPREPGDEARYVAASMVIDRQKDTNTQNDYHNPTMRGPH